MTLHEKAKNKLLKATLIDRLLRKKVPFTTEMLNRYDEDVRTVWHIAAANDSLQDIPESLFTEESLNKVDKHGNTVFHIAAKRERLKDIPVNFQ